MHIRSIIRIYLFILVTEEMKLKNVIEFSLRFILPFLCLHNLKILTKNVLYVERNKRFNVYTYDPAIQCIAFAFNVTSRFEGNKSNSIFRKDLYVKKYFLKKSYLQYSLKLNFEAI